MRLIDADALKEDLHNKMLFDTNKMRLSEKLCYEVIMISALKKIDEQPTATHEWIPCSERNPDEEGEYIVTFANDCFEGMKFVNTALWYPKWQKWGMYDDVLAWMPKPEAWEPNFEQSEGKENAIDLTNVKNMRKE